MSLRRRDRRRAQCAIAMEVLERVGLRPEFAERYPHELSGGQKQRVNIARALTVRPKLIVCDEVVAALDVSIQADMLNLFADLQRDFGLTYLFITHDLGVVSHISDRIAVMYLGVLRGALARRAIRGRPLHPYTEALLSAEPRAAAVHHAQLSARSSCRAKFRARSHPPSGCRFRTRCRYVKSRCAIDVPPCANSSPAGGSPAISPIAKFSPNSTRSRRQCMTDRRCGRRAARRWHCCRAPWPASPSAARPARSHAETRRHPARLGTHQPVEPRSRHRRRGLDHAFLYTIFDTLIEFECDTLKPMPGLAESWKFADPKTLVLNIRPGVLFHDGTPLDAEAVKFNLERPRRSALQHQGRLSPPCLGRGHRPDAGHAQAEPPDTALPLILADRAGMMVLADAVKAAPLGKDHDASRSAPGLCLCQLGRRREDRASSATRNTGSQPALP